EIPILVDDDVKMRRHAVENFAWICAQNLKCRIAHGADEFYDSVVVFCRELLGCSDNAARQRGKLRGAPDLDRLIVHLKKKRGLNSGDEGIHAALLEDFDIPGVRTNRLAGYFLGGDI